MRWFILASVLGLPLIGCGDDPTAPPNGPAQLGEEFVLRLGESAEVEGSGLSIRFAHVLEDSRCPPEAFCVWAGNATLVLDIARINEPAELAQLCTNTTVCSRELDLHGFDLELVGLDPPSLPNTALEYRVTLCLSVK